MRLCRVYSTDYYCFSSLEMGYTLLVLGQLRLTFFYYYFYNMDKTEGSITDGNEESILFTCSEEEKQTNEINKANASLVFNPKFIPIYPELLDKLTMIEAMLYGFIDFYMSTNSGRMYFTNEQFAQILRCSKDSISNSMKRLEDWWYITTSRKVKAWWWQIRFINSVTPLNGNNPICKNGISVLATTEIPTFSIYNNKINNNKTEKEKPEQEKPENTEGLEKFIQDRNKITCWTKKWMLAVNKITADLKKVRATKWKEYTEREIRDAVNNYADEVEHRKDNGDGYVNHRFTLYEFLKQSNWLQRFINHS